jgi:hypothetical protein
MQAPSVELPLAALLLWADSVPHVPACCSGPQIRKCKKFCRRQNISTCQDFSDFRQTIAVNISAHRRENKTKIGENKK